MHQFFPSRKSSTPGGAAQPASERNTLGSAEQAAGSAGQPASSIGSAEQPISQLHSVKDVQKWLASDCVSLDTAEIQRLRHAVQILANAKPKQADIRLLQKPSNWNVTQTIKAKPKPLPDVIEELRVKVVETARKVQRQLMASAPSGSGSAEQPALTSAGQPGTSSAMHHMGQSRSSASSSAMHHMGQSRP